MFGNGPQPNNRRLAAGRGPSFRPGGLQGTVLVALPLGQQPGKLDNTRRS